jgi:hypothetical protein
MRNAIAALGVVLALSACGSSLPPAADLTLEPVPGVALPFRARAMIFVAQGDLERPLVIGLTRYQTEQTAIHDGAALAEAGRVLLAKGIGQVAVNDPSIRPQIVVRLSGKAAWSRTDNMLRLGCTFDAFTADGIPLGSFVNRFESKEPDYAGALEPGYARCLKRPTELFLASPGLARLAGAGFRDPPAAAVEEWMRNALGPLSAPR